jgi:Methyltransferase domain
MNTKYDLKFLKSRWAAHFSTEEKESLKDNFSKQRDRQLFFKQKKAFAPPTQINDINYHKMLNTSHKNSILIVGGEGKSVFKNSKTLNLYPGSHANITSDITRTCFKNQTFDVIFFERVGFGEYIFGSRAVGAEFQCLEECYRILKPHGRLIIITGSMYEKTVNDLLQKSGKWIVAPEMKILNSHLPINKYAKAQNELIHVPLHFFKSQKEISDKK